MKKTNKYIYKKLLIILLIICAQSLFSQDHVKPTYIALLGKSFQDSVVLRWGIDNIDSWEMARAYGYQLERMSLDDRTNKVVDNYKVISPTTIRPWTKEEFKARLVPGDSLAAMVYKCLYQPSKEIAQVPELLQKMWLSSEDRKARFTMFLLAADLNTKAADAAGLRYVDKDVEPGMKYIYRISIQGASAENIDSTYFVIKSDDRFTEGPMRKPQSFTGDKRVIIRWATEARFTAYQLERTQDFKTFTAVNSGPIVPWLDNAGQKLSHLTFKDSIDQNGVDIYYRVRGITYFGEMSEWSQPVLAQGSEGFKVGSPRITSAENTIGREIDVRWEVDESLPIAGFVVRHTTRLDSQSVIIHKDLLPRETRNFKHGTASEFLANHYTVTAIYETGEAISSLPWMGSVKDQAPPSKPQGLTGVIDQNGIVTLTWAPNAERDLTGYFVLLANQADHEFMNLTPFVIQETTFTDTVNLNTLTEEVFYKVQAKDRSGKISEFSDTLFIKRPDIIPPSAPVIRDYKVRDTTLYLSWNQSTSKDLDHHVLVSRTTGQDWVAVGVFEKGISEAHVAIPGSGITEFSLYAVDDADLESEKCFPVGVKSTRKKKKVDIKEFNAILENNLCRLSWVGSFDNSIGKYFIYRSVDGSPLRRYKVIKTPQNEFLDKDVVAGKKYNYELQFRLDSGLKSEWIKQSISIN